MMISEMNGSCPAKRLGQKLQKSSPADSRFAHRPETLLCQSWQKAVYDKKDVTQID